MKKKVAFISDHASPLAILGGVDNGGQNVYVAELSEQLVQKGYAVDIYTRKDNRDLEETVKWKPHIRVIHIEAGPQEYIPKERLLGYMDVFTANMLHYIQRHQINYALIHAHFFMSALVAANLKKYLQIPYVVTFHALGLVRKIYQKEKDAFPPERINIEKRVVADANQIIAECPQDREDLITHYGADPAKITIIPCGFNPKEFYPMDKQKARLALNLDLKEKIILQLGRMVPRKGVDNVIHAVAKLKEFNSSVRLVIVGGEADTPDPDLTPEINRLQQIAVQENVFDKVVFTGRRKRDVLKYYYAASDIFVSTPWYEPFGITPLEAMACGIPVIGANVGGIKYSVADNESGFLVPPRDPCALAERITQLLSDEALYHAMQKNAIKRVNKFFTWSKVADKFDHLYEKVLLSMRKKPVVQEYVSPLESLSLRSIEQYLLNETLYNKLKVQ
ncbi:MAG TPA: glycosyltransferase family 1 protein [Chitinophagaceae bacterium]